MKTITVSASKEYPILIGSGLMPQLGELASAIRKNCKVAVISDTNVMPLYGQLVNSSLGQAGFQVVNYTIPAGEASKNGQTYLMILSFLAENRLTRGDMLVALGGGVVGDMTGFVAATYLRGIPYIQVPTSLLAMVDSSVGGKTAIDLPAGKNLVGAFYQPSLVLCDTDALNSLPDNIFRDGCAEVIKYGILYDEALFRHLAGNRLSFDRESVISRCVELKRDVVAEDEFDTGARQRLNLGHTIGHGVEACSNFSVSHGQAVSIGMTIVSKAGAALGFCSNDTADLIRNTLLDFGLPCSASYDADALYSCALSDKKRSGGTVNLIIPERIGFCRIQPMPVEELKAFIEKGL